MKTYGRRSDAIKGLKRIGIFTEEQVEKLLQSVGDRFGFEEEDAKKLLKKKVTSLPYTSSVIVRDGKKVTIRGGSDGKTPERPAVEKKVDLGKGEDDCPLCGADESSQTWSNEPISCHCHSCNKAWSVKTRREVRVGHTRENVPNGYTIEKDRPVQNGVKRPSKGTLCGNVWDEFDRMVNGGNPPTSKDLNELAESNNWNRNNVVCEFYNWRKFNGIKGRQT